jgi:two-component system sensor histidine kinase VicK
MTRSIKWRMVSIYVLLVLIVMIASGTLIVTKIRNNAYKDIEENLKGAISDMKNRGISDAATEEEIIIKCQDYINSYQDSDRKIYLLNTNGIVTFPEKYTGTSSYFNTMVMAALNDSPINKSDFSTLNSQRHRFCHLLSP